MPMCKCCGFNYIKVTAFEFNDDLLCDECLIYAREMLHKAKRK